MKPVNGYGFKYGNFCGHDGSGTGFNAVDSACAQHDICYINAGVSGRAATDDPYYKSLSAGQRLAVNGCNQDLCNRISAIPNTNPSVWGARNMILAWFRDRQWWHPSTVPLDSSCQ